MALIATISKAAVHCQMPKMWNVALNMILTDNDVEVINKDYSVRFRTGDSIAAKQARFIDLMQADIDKYKSERTIYNAAALNTVATNVEAALVV